MRRRKVYRSREWARGLALSGAGIVVGLLAYVVDAEHLTAALRIAAFGCLAFIAYFLLWRVAGSGIRAADDGITVVNPLRTQRVSWSQIREFEVEPWALLPGIGTVRMLDGSVIRVFGIETPHPLLRPTDMHAYELMDELNGLLAEATAS